MDVESTKPLEEKCGIVTVYSSAPSYNLRLALTIASGVQHRGQQGAGIALKTRKKIHWYKENGLLREIFTEKLIKTLNRPVKWILVHCRYGTNGSYHPSNLQPCIITAGKDTIAVVHNGEFAGVNELKKLYSIKAPRGTSDTYIFAQCLAKTQGANWDERIKSVLNHAKGAFSLLIGVNDTIYAARDPFGIRPLILGKVDDNWIIASETHAFDKADAKIMREIKKGEIIKLDKQGLHVIQQESKADHHFCDFEWAYFSKPNSLLSTHEKKLGNNVDNWQAVSTFREKTGTILAQEAPIKNASFAVGVPDSGVYIATGYASALGIPYKQVLVRDHFDKHGSSRLFMRDDEKHLIGQKVLGKISVVPEKRLWKDAIVIVGDDSIVRGNVSQRITKAIFDLGAKEVHWVVGFPPVMHRCHLGVSMRSRQELIAPAYRGNPQKIASAIGATSVNYISPRGFIKARLLFTELKIPHNPKEIFLANGGCGGCITGLYPVSRSGQIYNQA